MHVTRRMLPVGAIGVLAGLLVSPVADVPAGAEVPPPTVTLAADDTLADDPVPVLPTGTPSASETAEDTAPAPGPGRSDRAPTCATDRSDRHPITRIAGSTRAGTAACASSAGYPDGTTSAVLARGDDAGGLADALAGTVLAHARTAPVLLTAPDVLAPETRDELQRLGVDDVVVLGGPTAVSQSVEEQVRELGITTSRLAGGTRAGTAAAIADEVGGTAAFVVNGRRPADALVAGAAAARAGAALLLVEADGVPDETVTALDGVTDVTVVGGFGVVGETADARLRQLVPAVARLGGASRFETAATVARAHPGAGTLHLVSGADRNLVDAIAGGWLGARADGGPVAYVAPDAIPQGTDRWLRLGAVAAAPAVRVLGGENAVQPQVVTALEERFDEAGAGGTPDQLRGMWVHLFDPSLKSRAGIERVLDAATGANLNTVVVQVARRSDAYYDSEVIPRTPDPSFPADLDLLDELVPAAHARGLDVHTWFSVMPTDHGDFDDETLPAEHINVRHGPESADPWMQTVNLPNYDYLDPAIPGVQDHVADMVAEVAASYDIDGVHLDYLRYGGRGAQLTPPLPEHPITEARYRDHGLDGESLHEFQAAQTQDLARRIYLEVADVAPDVVVSAAVLALGQGPSDGFPFEATRTYDQKAQHWPSWIAEGILDHAYPMMYFDQDRYATWFEEWRRFAVAQDSPDTVVAPGLGAYLNDDEDKAGQTAAVSSALDGAVVYSYQSEGIDGGTPYFNALSSTTFATPAAVPAVPRKDAPSRGHVLVQVGDGDVVTLRGPDGTTITRRADATGHAGFVHLAPGTWELLDDGDVATTLEVTAGAVSRATL